jgi:hypothetical protein
LFAITKVAATSTTWKHFRNLRKWNDTMLPELLWEFLQGTCNCRSIIVLWVIPNAQKSQVWDLVNRPDEMLAQSFSGHFLCDLWSLITHWIIHGHCQGRRHFEAGISGPDFVQSRKQILSEIMLIVFRSFRSSIQNQSTVCREQKVIITFLHEIDRRTFRATSGAGEVSMASDSIK